MSPRHGLVKNRFTKVEITLKSISPLFQRIAKKKLIMRRIEARGKLLGSGCAEDPATAEVPDLGGKTSVCRGFLSSDLTARDWLERWSQNISEVRY